MFPKISVRRRTGRPRAGFQPTRLHFRLRGGGGLVERQKLHSEWSQSPGAVFTLHFLLNLQQVSG